MVETASLGAWPSKEARDEWSLEARSLLQRCLLPDLDVLLPTMISGAQGERFFVAAFADDANASVLANRIRGQFERILHVKHTGLTLLVSYSMLPPLPRDVGASMDTIVTGMASHLENAIKSHTLPGAVDHE